jgi:hypothetical protein
MRCDYQKSQVNNNAAAASVTFLPDMQFIESDNTIACFAGGCLEMEGMQTTAVARAGRIWRADTKRMTLGMQPTTELSNSLQKNHWSMF